LETKQLHSETCSNQSIGMSYWRLSARWCWNLTCFSRRNKTDSSREGSWLAETNSRTSTFPRKMQVCQPSPQKPYCYCASCLRVDSMLEFALPQIWCKELPLPKVVIRSPDMPTLCINNAKYYNPQVIQPSTRCFRVDSVLEFAPPQIWFM
jgi:hypothetical protein